jgi:phosphate uptake regulator
MVSLPSKWVKKFGVKKGDEIDLEEKDNGLMISSGKHLKAELSFKAMRPRRLIEHQISTAYKMGYDKLRVSFEDPADFKIIQEKVNYLIGFEIIEQSEKECVIRSVAETSNSEFDNILKRAFITTLDLANKSYDSIKKGDLTRLGNIKELEPLVDRLTTFCKRAINKDFPDEKKVFMYFIVSEIERIADEYRDICDALKDKKIKLNSETLDFYKEVNDYLNLFYDIFYQRRMNLLMELFDKKSGLIETAYGLLEKQKNGIVNHHLLSIVMHINGVRGHLFALTVL